MAYTKAKYAENLLSGKECSNCAHQFICKKRNKELYGTCVTWREVSMFGPARLLRIVRLGYPNTVRGQIMSVQPMAAPSNVIFYNTPVDKDEEK